MTWPVSERHAEVELIVVCREKSHKHDPMLLQHYLLSPALPVAIHGLVVEAPQQQHGDLSPKVHPFNDFGVADLQCPRCGLRLQRRRKWIADLMRRLADDDDTAGRVVTRSLRSLLN
ncbi:MAG: hypothetical protein ACR2FF_04325 [Mycobacteriales bacterium]